jgi:hypothetical protein
MDLQVQHVAGHIAPRWNVVQQAADRPTVHPPKEDMDRPVR